MSDQRRIYAESVWSAFKDKAATPSTRMMSPAEWALLSKWVDRGIPLRIVLRAIRDHLGHPRTLLTLEASVQEAWRHWQRALA